MTKTIKEITEKFDEIIEVYEDNKYYDFITTDEQEDDDVFFTERKVYRKFKDDKYKNEFHNKLEEVVLSFTDNSDDLATAFAMFITCVIRHNLGDENETYQQTLFQSVNRIILSNLEDSKQLKDFLKEFSCAVCDNDYNKIEKLHNDYCYSVTSLYLFCYKMFLYYDYYIQNSTWNKAIFSELKTLYSEIVKNSDGNDMSNYVLGLDDYKIIYETADYGISSKDNKLLPYCSFISQKELSAITAPFNWKQISQILNIATGQINIVDFCKKVLAFFKNQDYAEKYYLDLETHFQNMINDISNLSSSKFYPWFSHKIKKEKDCDTQREIINNNQALHIPAFIPTPGDSSDINKLLNDNIMLDNKNDELKEAQEEKSFLVNDFSHRYKNMKTDMLFEISDKLINECEILLPPEIKEEGVKVLFESEVKQRLTAEADMLNLRFKDKVGMLQTEIKKSIEYSSGKNYSISDIINNAIKRCMITVIHGGDMNLADAIIDNYFADYDIEYLEKSFDTDVLFKKDCNAIEWLSHNKIVKLNVNISDKWEKFFFVKYQYADNIITDLLVDLIMNILKYADKNQPVFIDFTENDEFMIIKSQNVISEYVNNMPGSHQGIKTQNILFNSINNTTDSITYKRGSDNFTIKVKIDKQLFGG